MITSLLLLRDRIIEEHKINYIIIKLNMKMVYLYKNYVIPEWTNKFELEIARDLLLLTKMTKWIGRNRPTLTIFQNFSSLRTTKRSTSSTNIVSFWKSYPKNWERNGKHKPMHYTLLILIAKIFSWTFWRYGYRPTQLLILFIIILSLKSAPQYLVTHLLRNS